MPLTKADREFIRLSVSEIMEEKLRPVTKKNEEQDKELNEVRQTVYGVNNDNGLNGDMKKMKAQFQKFWIVSGVGQGMAVGIGVWLRSMWKG